MERCRFCQGDLKLGTRRCRQCGRTQSAPLTGTPTQPAATPLPVAPVGSQGRMPDPPTIEVSAQDKALKTPGTQESESKAQPSDLTSAPEEKPGAKTVHEATATEATHQEGIGSATEQTTSSVQPTQSHEQGTAAKQQEATPPEVAVVERESHLHEEVAKEVKEGGEEEEEKEGPITTFRKRRIAFKTLSRPLQVLLVVTLAQIGVVALLLATHDLPQLQVSSGVVAGGQFFVVPVATFIVLAVSITVGTWFALAGSLRVHWSVRLLVLALATGMLAYLPIFELALLARSQEEPFVTEVRLRWAQLALLALFWVWAAGISLLRWRAKRKGITRPIAIRQWHGWTFGIIVVPILIYYSLEFVIWRAYASAGFSGAGVFFFLGFIGSQSLLLPFFLGLLLYWSSTDLLEWGEIVARSIVAATRRVRASWLLVTVTSLAAVGMIVNVLRLDGRGILLGLVLLAVLIVVVALVVRFARIHADWPAQIPPLALLVGAIFLFIQHDLTSGVTNVIALSQGLVQGVVESLYDLVSVPIMLVALTIGLVLVARGRMGKPKQGAVGLFLIMVVLFDFTASLSAILSAAGYPVALLQQPFHLLNSVQFYAAVGVLIWIIRLLVRRRPLTEAARPLTSAFLLLTGLQAIDWLSDLADGITALGERSALLLAGLFVLTVLWDFVTSGEQVTNTDSPAFPREGRILLYMGYTLVATSILVYIGSLRVQTTGAPAPNYLSNDIAATLGLYVLGPSMVVLAFLLSMGRRLQRTSLAAAAPQPTRHISPRSIQLGMLGSGALAIALVMVFLVVSAVPRIVHTSQMLLSRATYTAAIPGPGCDPGGALWTIQPDAPISIRCLSTGLQVTDDPKKLGLVGFSPPGNTQVLNYRVSVHVDLSNFPDGCVGIGTLFSETSYYGSIICANGEWFIEHRLGDSTTVLAAGRVAPARAYTIGVTTYGLNQRFAINGIEVTSFSDVASTTGLIELEQINFGTGKESAVFSDFVFTSLS